MNKSQQDNQTIEEQLADFTDRILENTTEEDNPKLAREPGLRALEQTAQRLKNAFPDDGPSEAVIQQMRQNILLEWKQRESKANKPFWRRVLLFVLKPREQRWQSQQRRQRWNAVTSLVVVAGVMLVTIFLLNKGDFNQPAASGQDLNSGVLAVTGVLLLLVLWIFRRKL